MLPCLEEMFENHRPSHSEYQLERFVIASQPTEWAQYQQVLREISSRWRSLKSRHIALQRCELDYEELRQKKVGAVSGSIAERRSKLDLAENRMQKQEVQKAYDEAFREFKKLYAIAYTLHQKFGKLSEAEKQRLDYEHWKTKAREQAALDMILQRRPGQATLTLARSLDLEDREALINEITNAPKELMDWYTSLGGRSVAIDYETLPQLTLEEM